MWNARSRPRLRVACVRVGKAGPSCQWHDAACRTRGRKPSWVRHQGRLPATRAQGNPDLGLGDPRHDILFVGYQAAGTPGRDIQRYGPRGGYVQLDGRRYDIRAQVHRIGGYSAHADQQDLIDFVSGIPTPPPELRLVHGDARAKAALAERLRARLPRTQVVIP